MLLLNSTTREHRAVAALADERGVVVRTGGCPRTGHSTGWTRDQVKAHEADRNWRSFERDCTINDIKPAQLARSVAHSLRRCSALRSACSGRCARARLRFPCLFGLQVLRPTHRRALRPPGTAFRNRFSKAAPLPEHGPGTRRDGNAEPGRDRGRDGCDRLPCVPDCGRDASRTAGKSFVNCTRENCCLTWLGRPDSRVTFLASPRANRTPRLSFIVEDFRRKTSPRLVDAVFCFARKFYAMTGRERSAIGGRAVSRGCAAHDQEEVARLMMLCGLFCVGAGLAMA